MTEEELKDKIRYLANELKTTKEHLQLMRQQRDELRAECLRLTEEKEGRKHD